MHGTVSSWGSKIEHFQALSASVSFFMPFLHVLVKLRVTNLISNFYVFIEYCRTVRTSLPGPVPDVLGRGWWALPGSISLKSFFSKKTQFSVVQLQVFFLFEKSFLANMAIWGFEKWGNLGPSEVLTF